MKSTKCTNINHELIFERADYGGKEILCYADAEHALIKLVKILKAEDK
jgi:hypothetical protein